MKGVLFSFIIIITMLTLVSFITIQKGLVYHSSGRIAINTRINSMLNFYESVLSDGGKALEIISKRGVASAINHIIANGAPLQNSNNTIKELITNGTINGVVQPIMQNSTLPDWENKIEQLGKDQGFDTTIVFNIVKVLPYDSWNILVSMDVYVNMSDSGVYTNITKSTKVSRVVNIEYFEDPLYPLNTLGRAANTVVRSSNIGNYTKNIVNGTAHTGWFRGASIVLPSSDPAAISSVAGKSQKVLVTDSTSGIEGTANQFGAVVSESASSLTTAYVDNAANAMSLVPNNTKILVDSSSGKIWHIENLETDVNNSYYHPSSNGASFLDRLEGMLSVQSKYSSQSSSVIGMESFVNKTYFSLLGLPVIVSKSNIDHLYFSNTTYTTYKVKSMESTFRVDKELDLNNTAHDVIYGVQETLE